jgi:hypothetical protein
MSIESQETVSGLQSETATQMGKVSPRSRSHTRRPFIVGGAVLLSAGFAFLIYSVIGSRFDA